jgi:hypothetical protein
MHPNSLENLKKGKRFSKTYKPARTGRRKDYLKEFIDENRISHTDLKTILENLITDYSFGDLDEIYVKGQKTLPVVAAALIKAMATELKKGRTDTVNSLIDRVYGKATQPLAMSGAVSNIPDDPVERQALAERLDKELKELDGAE